MYIIHNKEVWCGSSFQESFSQMEIQLLPSNNLSTQILKNLDERPSMSFDEIKLL